MADEPSYGTGCELYTLMESGSLKILRLVADVSVPIDFFQT
jgi:hypothetical protein